MSIDAKISSVSFIAAQECAHCKSTGVDPETNWDDCPRCHGAGGGKSQLRLHLSPRESGGCAGQEVLTIVDPTEADYRGLIGTEIWGGSGDIMIGEKRWAKRIGYTRIKLIAEVSDE